MEYTTDGYMVWLLIVGFILIITGNELFHYCIKQFTRLAVHHRQLAVHVIRYSPYIVLTGGGCILISGLYFLGRGIYVYV